ncbi:MAG: DUF4139 domain-containing protein [Bacteroidetes bacterium]|nr:DUF4139 domain-containing protein [Bacteroidota bacterium]
MPTYEIRCENTTKPLLLSCRAKIVQTTGFDWKDIKLKLSTANPNKNHNRPILYPIFVDFMQPDYYKEQMERRKDNMGYLDAEKKWLWIKSRSIAKYGLYFFWRVFLYSIRGF